MPGIIDSPPAPWRGDSLGFSTATTPARFISGAPLGPRVHPPVSSISDAYFLGRALINVAQGMGDWTDVAMAAVGLALPVGGAAFKMLKMANDDRKRFVPNSER